MEAFRIRVLRKFNKSLICYPCTLTADHCDNLEEGDSSAEGVTVPILCLKTVRNLIQDRDP